MGRFRGFTKDKLSNAERYLNEVKITLSNNSTYHRDQNRNQEDHQQQHRNQNEEQPATSAEEKRHFKKKLMEKFKNSNPE